MIICTPKKAWNGVTPAKHDPIYRIMLILQVLAHLVVSVYMYRVAQKECNNFDR